MPFVNIRALKEVLGERAAEKKDEIARRVTDAISESTGIPHNSIWVVFEDVPATEWYVGGKSQAVTLKEKQKR
jgi:4-oxalocrotonate tautomerase